MNQSFLQKLKRVKFTDLFHVVFFILAIPASLIYKLFHNDLWLFCDSPGEARDNAYWLFRYVREKDPARDIVFAINYNSHDYEKVRKFGRTVSFGSYKHWVLYLSAANVISSQKASGPNASVCYVLDRFRIFPGNKVFLQHGIIKDDIAFLYYRYTNIRLFTCSTQREFEYVRDNYGYPEGNVRLLGLCRFDELLKPVQTEKSILIMPTWRRWLSQPTGKIGFSQLEEQFLQSDYYRRWNEFLNDPAFLKVIEKENWNVVFYIHRESQKYLKYFDCCCPKVKIASFSRSDVQDLLRRSAILVTDYSSVAMDFALLDKPVFYYQFDYDVFRNRHWGEGYFDYKSDGFGPVCEREDDLLEQLILLIEGKIKEDEKYQMRRQAFFTLKDRKNCERTFQAIQEL